MKRIAIFFLVLIMLSSTIIPIRAEEPLRANLVLQFLQEDGKVAPGHIYFTGDTALLQARYFNNSSQADMALTITYAAVGRRSGAVWNHTETAVIPSYDNITQEIFVCLPEELKIYDIYDLTVTLSDGQQSQSFTYVFSYVRLGEKNQQFGMNTHFTHVNYTGLLEDGLTLMEKSGVSAIRDSLVWADFETESGFAVPSDFQQVLTALESHGIDLLQVLCFGNALHTPSDKHLPETEEEVEAFCRYSEEVAKALQQTLTHSECYYEIWNEPNGEGDFNAAGARGDVYGELVKAVAPRVRVADPGAYVVGYASSGINDYIPETVATGASDFLDAASFHPYPEYNPAFSWATGEQLPQWVVAKIPEFKSMVGKSNLWITENGWSTAENTLEQQAQYLVRMYALTMAESQIEKYFWYEYICSASETEHTAGYGILEGKNSAVPLAARPAFLAMSAMNAKLAGTSVRKKNVSDQGSNRIYQLDFEGEQGDVILMWSTASATEVQLDLGSSAMLRTDLYGNTQLMESETGIYTVTVDTEPAYFEVAKLPEEEKKLDWQFNPETEVCTIQGYLDSRTSGTLVNMMLYLPDCQPDSLNREDLTQNLAAIEQVTTDENGRFSCQFKTMSRDGSFLLQLAAQDGEEMSCYINIDGRLSCRAEVRDGTLAQLEPGESFICDVTLDSGLVWPSQCDVYVALYKDKKLTGVYLQKDATPVQNVVSVSVQQPEEFDTLRAFVWKEGNIPISQYAELKK